jgi:hypothetical protein
VFEFGFKNNEIQFEFKFLDEVHIKFAIRFVHIHISQYKLYFILYKNIIYMYLYIPYIINNNITYKIYSNE